MRSARLKFTAFLLILVLGIPLSFTPAEVTPGSVIKKVQSQSEIDQEKKKKEEEDEKKARLAAYLILSQWAGWTAGISALPTFSSIADSFRKFYDEKKSRKSELGEARKAKGTLARLISIDYPVMKKIATDIRNLNETIQNKQNELDTLNAKPIPNPSRAKDLQKAIDYSKEVRSKKAKEFEDIVKDFAEAVRVANKVKTTRNFRGFETTDALAENPVKWLPQPGDSLRKTQEISREKFIKIFDRTCGHVMQALVTGSKVKVPLMGPLIFGTPAAVAFGVWGYAHYQARNDNVDLKKETVKKANEEKDKNTLLTMLLDEETEVQAGRKNKHTLEPFLEISLKIVKAKKELIHSEYKESLDTRQLVNDADDKYKDNLGDDSKIRRSIIYAAAQLATDKGAEVTAPETLRDRLLNITGGDKDKGAHEDRIERFYINFGNFVYGNAGKVKILPDRLIDLRKITIEKIDDARKKETQKLSLKTDSFDGMASAQP